MVYGLLSIALAQVWTLEWAMRKCMLYGSCIKELAGKLLPTEIAAFIDTRHPCKLPSRLAAGFES